MQHFVEKSIARIFEIDIIKDGAKLWKNATIPASKDLSALLTSKTLPIIGTKIAISGIIKDFLLFVI